jgi:hypothetical protein
MWGDSETLQLSASVLGTPARSTQLAKITYKRPESWNFAFQAILESMSAPTADFTLDIWFDLTIGIGRTFIKIPEFEHYRLFNAGGVGTPIPQMFWSTQVPSPNRSRSITAPATNSGPGVTDFFVAEDIQCQCRVLFLGSPANNISLQVSSLFAPRVHVRPEWFEGQFRGGETGGT